MVPSPHERAAFAQLGPFALNGELGVGGSGTVYRARWGHRLIALKVLRGDVLTGASAKALFLAEARRLGDIDHPGIVKVLGFGDLPDGRPYLAMELLEGQSLGARLEVGPLPLVQAAELFGQLGRAIAALHDQGMVHRDIKSDNVMLVENGRFAVLLDFGIAKELAAPDSTITQEGVVRGTPAYMAPERFYGESASVVTDVYELAAVFFEMLAGELPWDHPERPDTRVNPKTLSALGVKVAARLDEIIARGLSTRADNRPASVMEFVVAVEQALGVTPSANARRTADLLGDGASGAAGASLLASDAATHAAQVAPIAQSPNAGPLPLTVPELVGGGPPTAPSGSAWVTEQPSVPPASFVDDLQLPVVGRKRRAWLLAALVVGAFAVVIGAAFVVGALGQGAAKQASQVAGEVEPASEPGAALIRPIDTAVGDDPWASVKPPGSLDLKSDRSTLATAAQLFPADVTLVLGVAYRDLLRDPNFGPVIRKLGTGNDTFELLALIASQCELPFSARMDWAVVGIVAGGDASHFDLVVRGDWTRKEVEGCLAMVAADTKGPPQTWVEGDVTRMTSATRDLWIGWRDPQTLFFSTRVGIDFDWMRARLSGGDSVIGTEPMATLAASLDQSRTMWIFGDVEQMGGHLIEGVPKALGLALDIELAEGAKGRGVLLFEDARDAGKATVAIETRLAEVIDDPSAAALLGKIAAVQAGPSVIIKAELTPFATSLISGFASDALGESAR